MDEQNYGNEQNGGNSNSQSGNYYQDYTANTSQYQPPYQNGGPNKANGMQIASLVLGIIGIPGCCCYGVVGLLCGIIGLVLAVIGNKNNRGSGVGIGGLVCSIIAILLGVLATVYYALILMGMFGSGPFNDMIRDMGYSY